MMPVASPIASHGVQRRRTTPPINLASRIGEREGGRKVDGQTVEYKCAGTHPTENQIRAPFRIANHLDRWDESVPTYLRTVKLPKGRTTLPAASTLPTCLSLAGSRFCCVA